VPSSKNPAGQLAGFFVGWISLAGSRAFEDAILFAADSVAANS
jgi:hypothetical protein